MPVRACGRARAINRCLIRPIHKKRRRAPPTLRRKIKRESMREAFCTDRPCSARRWCRGWTEGRVFRARDGAPGDGPTCAFRRSLRLGDTQFAHLSLHLARLAIQARRLRISVSDVSVPCGCAGRPPAALRHGCPLDVG